MNHGLLLSGAENIDFMIHGIFSYELFGQTVWITTSHVCILLVMMVMLLFFVLAGSSAKRALREGREVPGTFLSIAEMIVEKLDGMVSSTMGPAAPKFANYMGVLFLFILLSNISGIFGLRPPTADYGVTLPLGLITFTMIHYNKFKYQKIKGVLKDMCTPWVIWAPINLIGYIAVPISISLRLFANVLSGTIIMALIYGLLGWVATAWPAALHVYFDLFSGAIQTYVFCMLTMTYIKDAIGVES